jgi:hypothetical protein
VILRVLGVVVLVVSLALVVFALFALADAERMALYLPIVAGAFDEHVDGADWRAHWERWSLGNLILACVGLVAGGGLYAKRLWALAVLASLFTLLLGLECLVLVSGYSKYAFELQGPLDLVAPAVSAGLLWLWFLVARARANRHAGE